MIRQTCQQQDSQVKVCKGCGELKPVTDFYRTGPIVRSKCKACYAAERRTPERRAIQHEKDSRPENRFSRGRALCRSRGIAWELTLDQYRVLVSKPCTYCEGPLEPTGIGLDRIEFLGPYSLHNVLPCCGICNDMRGVTYSVEEMMLLGPVVRKIREMRAERGGPKLMRSLEQKYKWHKQGLNYEPSRWSRKCAEPFGRMGKHV